MIDPILTSIATTLATKAAGGLYDLVSKVFRRHPQAQLALEAAQGAEPDSAPVHALAERLAEVTAAEPEFDRELRELADHGDVINGDVINKVSGHVTGNVVQARDITGNISF
jgi:hypothetical protein